MEKKKNRIPLSQKIAIMVLIFALAMGAVSIIMSYVHYKDEMYADYEKFAMNIAAVAASQIDPDQIQTWLTAEDPGEEYEQTLAILSQIRENGGVEYLYVVKPEIAEVFYVMDTDPSENAIPRGYHEAYYAGAFADNAGKLARGERIEPIVSNEEFGWLMSVYYPMRTSDGAPAGYVGVDVQMTEVMTDLRTFAVQMVYIMLAFTVAFILIMIEGSSRLIANPITELSEAAKRLVEAEENKETAETDIFKQLTITSNDEIGELYESLAQMEGDINTYIRELVSVTSENERITAELTLAQKIQTGMIPHIFPPFPGRNEFRIYASMDPAKEVGGDFYDFFLIDSDHLCVVIADVSGKGVPAALFMMVSKILLKSNAMLGYSPAEILAQTNQTICSNNQEEMFVTVWLGILEISTGKMIAANAGHEYPVIRHPDGFFELFRDKHGFVIGGMSDLKYKEYELQLEPGTKIFVYTDGVTEATDKNGKMFGLDRVTAALNEEPEGSPETMLKNMRRAVDGFVMDAEQFDDLTMLCLEYRGLNPASGQEEGEAESPAASTAENTAESEPESTAESEPENTAESSAE